VDFHILFREITAINRSRSVHRNYGSDLKQNLDIVNIVNLQPLRPLGFT